MMAGTNNRRNTSGAFPGKARAAAFSDSQRPRPFVLIAVVALHLLAAALLLRSVQRNSAMMEPALIAVAVPPPAKDGGAEDESAAPAITIAPVTATVPPPMIAIAPDSAPPAPAPMGGEGNSAGSGTGTGSGTGSGVGDGAGAGGTPARRITGTITKKDYPKIRRSTARPASVTITLGIDRDGRPQSCRIARPSGDDTRDRLTCKLALERFRYEPARDAAGNPVPATVGWRQDWLAD